MEAKCQECGIAAKRDDGGRWCEKYQFAVCVAGAKNPDNCYYFIELEEDGDEPFDALQYLVLKENELVSRRMRGPV